MESMLKVFNQNGVFRIWVHALTTDQTSIANKTDIADGMAIFFYFFVLS